jgi:hypothetical protein
VQRQSIEPKKQWSVRRALRDSRATALLAAGGLLVAAVYVCGALAVGRAAPAPDASFSARLVFGPVKIRPYGNLPAAPSSPLPCARNEYCSFQAVISTEVNDLAGVDVSLSDFTAVSGARIPADNATLYREGFLNVFYRSSEQGDIGEWPDPLIPKVDPEYGELRNAFPVDVRRISPAYQRYLASKGRTIPGGSGRDAAISGGHYTGALARRYVIEVAQPGPLGTATFRWWSEPGSAELAPERFTSAVPQELDSGVNVTFLGDGRKDDFVAGEEFWIFAGPVRHQPVWVDVLIPADAPAGVYSGQLRVAASGHTPIFLPVRIEVFGFALPSTTSLANTFGMYWPALPKGHFDAPLADERKEEQRKVELGHAYARAALRNAITLSPSEDLEPVYAFAPDGALLSADYSRYDQAVGAFLDGRGTPQGARWTSLPLPRLSRLAETQKAVALRDFVRHARDRGWYSRLFDYTFDEPQKPADFAALAARARLVSAVDPAIPRLVTTDLDASLAGQVTRWCPVVNSLEPKNSSPREWWNARRRPRRSDYQPRLRAGDSLWWYQSCMSHGCDGMVRGPEYDDWPSYMVDISAVANRVFGLLSAVTYDLSGILYWDVAYSHSFQVGRDIRSENSWGSLYYFGGNGDGSFFYPGRPEQIGGTRHIPIESLRLKMIRDSFYDAEYALLLRTLGDEAYLRREAGRLVQKAWQWNHDPGAWADLHGQLGRRIAKMDAARR